MKRKLFIEELQRRRNTSPPIFTTLAIGEESFVIPLPPPIKLPWPPSFPCHDVTTMALGEEAGC
ncbi:MAG TPA: hypothetical protein VIO14_12070 [Dehalococcoidia bacterium]